MANFVYVNKYTGVDDFNVVGTPIGVESIERPSGKKAYILTHITGISAGSVASLELENTNADYVTTGTAEIVVIVEGTSTTVTDFEILETPNADDATSATVLEDFPSIGIQGNKWITSKKLSVSASKYITLRANTGNIGKVNAILVE